MPAISVTGTTLEYAERGQGEPVILVHGSLDDYRYWEAQMDAFGSTHHVFAYSRRYHHPNPCHGVEDDYSADLHAEDLAALMEAWDLESAHLVGHSYGAYTSLVFAARYPERVKSLVLGEPPLLAALDRSARGRMLRDDFLTEVLNPVAELLQQGEVTEGVKMFLGSVAGDGVFDQLPPEARQVILDNGCALKAEMTSGQAQAPFSEQEARRITMPTMLLTGAQSLTLFQSIVGELQQRLPNHECVTVPDSSHEMAVDNPEAYNRIVLDFLARHAR